MKEHIQRELVNELTKIAQQYGKTQQLRDRISHTISDYLNKNTQIKEEFNQQYDYLNE